MHISSWFFISGTINSSLPCCSTGHLEGRESCKCCILIHIDFSTPSSLFPLSLPSFVCHTYTIFFVIFFLFLSHTLFSIFHLALYFWFCHILYWTFIGVFSSIVSHGLPVGRPSLHFSVCPGTKGSECMFKIGNHAFKSLNSFWQKPVILVCYYCNQSHSKQLEAASQGTNNEADMIGFFHIHGWSAPVVHWINLKLSANWINIIIGLILI